MPVDWQILRKGGKVSSTTLGVRVLESSLSSLKAHSPAEGVHCAHSEGALGESQSMLDHVTNVTYGSPQTTGAASRVPDFLRQDAIYAGLFHDFGKYSELFRRRLKGEVSGLDHWCPGAHFLLKHDLSDLAAIAVHAHHVGLGAWARVSTLRDALTSIEGRTPTITPDQLADALGAFVADGFSLDGLQRGRKLCPTVASMLDARMVLSALVDADYADTAHHMRGETRPLSPVLDVGRALELLESYVATCGRDASSEVKEVRDKLRRAAIDAANQPRGLFTLEAPTGSGKTLAMLEFALRHMHHHPKLGRIIVALPFLSITDQTVSEYRKALGDQAKGARLLEHTSLADWRRTARDDGNAAGDNSRRAEEAFSEDWLPPIVVTTTVQLFESLFSNHPGTCRKLCSIANSVILVDEVQTLPRPLLSATARALSRLAHPDYGCSVVLSTATQPLLSTFEDAVEKEKENVGWKPVSIISRKAGLYEQTRRYEIDWSKCDAAQPWDSLAEEIATQKRALCIVNTRKHARLLTELVLQQRDNEQVRHLSTNMCAAHRRQVLALDMITDRDEPCILISTQCVEAGVDLDFPVVYRALAPLDAIAQAAGRCNRAGAGSGKVYVFKPEEEVYPGKLYEQGAQTTDSLRKQVLHLDPQDPIVFDTYFNLLYTGENIPGSTKELEKAIEERDFPEVARIYRLIEHKDVVHVLVPYRGAPDVPERLTSRFFREAQPFVVDANRKDAAASLWIGNPLTGTEDWYALSDTRAYDEMFGLRLDKELPIVDGSKEKHE